MLRLSLNLSLVFLLAAPGFSVAADDSKTGQPGSAIAMDHIGCSLHPKAEEPSDPSSTSAIPHTEKFVAREHFKDASFQTYVLNASSSDRDILAKLGQGHESSLVDVWCLLRQQPNGNSGALQTNSTPNIFFVRDVAGELGVVDAIWGGAGWEIGASPVGDKPRWSSGTRVFSR